MKEVGKVIKTDGKRATVKVDKKDECSKCGMCLFPKNATSIEFTVDNGIGAKDGDIVSFESVSDGKLLGALLVFLVPLLIIGVSAIISYLVIKDEIWTLILSLIGIVLWFAVLSLIDKKLKNAKNFRHRITAIVGRAQPEIDLNLTKN